MPDRDEYDIRDLELEAPLASMHEDRYHAFSRPMPIDGADEKGIVFCALKDRRALEAIGRTRAKIVLADRDLHDAFKGELETLDKTILFYEDPKRVFVHLVNRCRGREAAPRIEETASIDPDARIGRGVGIGAFSVIGKCRIGEGSTIGAHTVIHDGVMIGKNVTIASSCDIGHEGFGFVREPDGRWVRFPHIGGLIIEDGVEMFPFCDVSRGSLGDTIIRRGTKMSFQVHVAHNCDIGPHCILTAGVRVAGSSSLGEACVLGNGAVVKDKIRVGSHVKIGAGAVVVRDVPDETTVVGNPAEDINTFKERRKPQAAFPK